MEDIFSEKQRLQLQKICPQQSASWLRQTGSGTNVALTCIKKGKSDLHREGNWRRPTTLSLRSKRIIEPDLLCEPKVNLLEAWADRCRFFGLLMIGFPTKFSRLYGPTLKSGSSGVVKDSGRTEDRSNVL